MIFFSVSKKVEDVIKYKVIIQKIVTRSEQDSGVITNILSFRNEFKLSPWDNKERENIVLILESPHIDEYDENFNPIQPANGATGRLIKQYLNDILSQTSLSPGSYNIVLMNPVPYQTSMIAIHKETKFKTLRNNVWKSIWGIQEIKDNFNTRLRKKDPILIINACTDKLSKYVSEELETQYSNILYVSKHPSSWMNSKYREIEKYKN